MTGNHILPGLDHRGGRRCGIAAAPVVYAVPVAVPEYGCVKAGVPLPGTIEFQDLSRRDGRVEPLFQTLHPFNEEVVDEQLQPGADVQGFLGAGLLCQGTLCCHGQGDSKQAGEERSSSHSPSSFSG